MSINFLNFCAKQTRDIDSQKLEPILAESVNLARAFSELSISEFEEKITNESNGYVCLAWFADYIALQSEAYSSEKEWIAQLQRNFSIAQEFFSRWKKSKSAEYLEMEGLF